jgi:hypothetical protein
VIDQLSLDDIAFVNQAADFRSYARTVDISRVVMSSQGFQFDADITPSWMTHVPGWGKDDPKGDPNDPGDLLYTICVGIHNEAGWWMSGFVQKYDFTPSGAPILAIDEKKQINNWQANWAYDARWSPMDVYAPKAGDTIALMLVAGNGRAGAGGQNPQRSNVVLVTIPSNGIGDFRFGAVGESVPPVVSPPEPPPVVIVPTDSTEELLTSILQAVHRVEDKIDALKDRLDIMDGDIAAVRRSADEIVKVTGYLKQVWS